jgi:hypothetical protein
LNHNQEARLIRFSGDGTGQGVCWDLIRSVSCALPEIGPRKKTRGPRDFVQAAAAESMRRGEGLDHLPHHATQISESPYLTQPSDS